LFSFSKIQEPGRAALEMHFKSSDKDTAETVLLNLERIKGNIPTRQEFQGAGSPTYEQNISIGFGPQVPITTRAILCNGAGCKPSTGAYYQPKNGSITFCPYFFSHRKDQGPGLLIHEIAHSLGFGGTVFDFAYGKDRLYAGLTTAEALVNADSYANLVEELATGKTRRMIVPRDSLGKCPTDWVPLVNAAIARAHQWARVADKVYTGPSSDPAAMAYQTVRDGLGKSVRIRCKPDGASNCRGGVSWFQAAGDAALYLCPDWKTLGEDDRSIAVLAGLIGYFGGPGKRADWETYAADAAVLTQSKLYPTPPKPPPASGHP
jgi:Lysine-specific metallo-endopeptidase